MSGFIEDTVEVDGYHLPVRLARLTGCPPETFELYGSNQFDTLQRYLNTGPTDFVLEIGCGAGRLAIPFSKILRPPGGYLGIDIISDSIRWCKENITGRHPHVVFYFENVHSPIHNPAGHIDAFSTSIPLPDSCVDKLFLTSVFTHIFPLGVANYLFEFGRVLKPGGIGVTTMFLLNEGSREAINKGKTFWTFKHAYQDTEICYSDLAEFPEGAVAYDEKAYEAMLRHCGLKLLRPPVYGTWSGLGGPLADGQDYVVFGKQ